MKGVTTLLDFVRVYNCDNDKKRAHDIYDEMILPLLDKKVIDAQSLIKAKILCIMTVNPRLVRYRHTGKPTPDKHHFLCYFSYIT